MTRRLIAATVTLDAAGAGTVSFYGPAQWSELVVSSIALAGESAAMPRAGLYLGAPTSGRLLATVNNGRTGSFRQSGDADVIGAGESWSVQWTGGTPGAVMTATLAGVERRVGR